MKLFIFIGLVFLACFHFVQAGNPFIKNYTISDGLPTNKIIDVYQDSKGFMWFATDAGVIRFDGSNFLNFSIADGLNDNLVIRIKEDRSGRIWFFNLNGTVNFYQNQILYNTENALVLNELKTNFYIIDFFEDTDSTLYFYNSLSEVFVVKNNQLINYRNFGFSNPTDIGLHYFCKSAENKFLLWTSAGIYQTPDFDDTLHLIKQPDGILKVFPFKDNKILVLGRSGYFHLYENEFLTKKNYLAAESQFINSILADDTGNLWISTYDKGLYCFNNQKSIFHFDVKPGQGLHIDNEGNIWVCSALSGIFRINEQVLKYRFIDETKFNNKGLTDLAKAIDGGIWTTNGESIFYIDKGDLFPQKISITGNLLDNIYHLKNNTLITHGNGTEMFVIENVVVNKKSNRFEYNRTLKLNYTVKKLAIDPEEKWLYSYMNNNLIVIKPVRYFKYFGARLKLGRINNVFINRDTQVVINSTKNYYLKNDTDLIYHQPLSRFDGLSINSHQVIDKKTELFNISGNRIVLHHEENFYDLTEKFRTMIDYRILDMTFYDSILFFFTPRSVYFITDPMQVTEGKSPSLNRLDIEFNNVNDILCNDTSLYIASDDGLLMIPIEHCINETTQIPVPYILKVSLDDDNYDFDSQKVVFKNINRLSIEFGSLNFSSFPSNYSYMLEGVDKNWIQSSESRVVYLNLPPGKYTFLVRARKGLENYSNAAALPVIVKPTLIQRTSFKVLLIIITLALLYSGFRVAYKNQLKKKETDHQLITLEHKALQSMMNPHFIFNALGSIQRYLLQNKAQEAGTYLSQFARLIRQNMNSLKSNSISLEDEMERLRNYLDLEKFRMNGKFSFTIENDESLDTEEIRIPSMIVQPFVENAVWHGVSHIDEEGLIMIKFLPEDEKRIVVLVEDNGIGITNSEIYSSSEQNLNMGTTLTRKRIQLIGERLKIDTDIITEERNPGEKYPGTRVKMIVPILPQA